MRQKKYWLPSTRAWMMAAKLFIPAYFGVTVVFAFEFWRYIIVGIILLISGKEGFIFCLGISTFVLALTSIWFLVLVGIYKIFLKLLWSNPPKWLNLPMLRDLIIRDFSILLIATLPFMIIFGLYVYLTANIAQLFADMKTPKLTYDLFLLGFSWLWAISAAYLYHWFPQKGRQVKG